MKNRTRRLLATGLMAVAFTAATLAAATPSSIIHVVTLYWKEGATDAQKKAALDGVKKMGTSIPGIKNVWIKTIKMQGDIENKPIQAVFVMEFESEAAFKAYDNHPAHRAWEKIYHEVRGESRTHDITN
ncbi:MAG TPA: Dabb family protein [Bryobacteraceae bacterium]|nr:Dabb family protein [Bryobacteraceae bacterium]